MGVNKVNKHFKYCICHSHKLVNFKVSQKLHSMINFFTFQDYSPLQNSFKRYVKTSVLTTSPIWYSLHKKTIIVNISHYGADSPMLTCDWIPRVFVSSISAPLSGRKQWSYQTPQTSLSFNNLQTLHQ